MIDIQNARKVADTGDLMHTTKMLYAALDELETAMKRITEQDRYLEWHKANTEFMKEEHAEEITRYESKLAKVIIPQEGDAEIIHSGMEYIEQRLMHVPDDCKEKIEMLAQFDLLLHRYLAAIEVA